MSREMPSFPHPLYASSGTAHHSCFPASLGRSRNKKEQSILSFLLSTATADAQPLLGKKWWLQICHTQ